MTRSELEELLPLYEEFHYAEDPASSGAKQAQYVFRSRCKQLYETESENFRGKVTLQAFIAGTLIPELLAHRKHSQTTFPTIQPEKK